jgi:hypothetical protein
MLILDGHLPKLISEFRIVVFFNVVFIMVLQYFLFHFFLLLNTLLQGRFEILNLSGSFMPTENQGTRSRAGGMSVSLARTDGRVVGGGVAGVLIAASPVQVCILSLSTLGTCPSVHFIISLDILPNKNRIENREVVILRIRLV